MLDHPDVSITQIVSETYGGRPVSSPHPNLRRRTELKFAAPADLAECDVLFLAVPHGTSHVRMAEYAAKARCVIDLSGDFRLTDASLYPEYYGWTHACPDRLGTFAYGLPEANRAKLAGATRISCGGCVAVASILALLPLARGNLLDEAAVVIDAKTGSSAGGHAGTGPSSHPERTSAIRPYAPSGHRHQPEIEQVLGRPVSLSIHAVGAVRGILVTAHVVSRDGIDERRAWAAYRDACRTEPFLRLVAAPTGAYRLPDPKTLIGSNFCDVGLATDPRRGRYVAFAALDNLVKGAAGNAVQCLNVAFGFDEKAGLGFPGLFPV